SWNEEVDNAEALAGDSQNKDKLSPNIDIRTEMDNDIASVPDKSIIIEHLLEIIPNI
ncbi:2230_t:CDS:1, partial [Paraglomus occultum]